MHSAMLPASLYVGSTTASDFPCHMVCPSSLLARGQRNVQRNAADVL